MADFNELPKGIPRKIAVEHLDNLEDIETFGQVCSFWRSETRDVNYTNFCPSKNIQLPWLMLADSPTSSYRRFYSLSKGMYRKIDLPRFDNDPDDHRRYFSSKGWLISVSRNRGLITFYDPFSNTVINPPNVPILDFMGRDEWDQGSYLYQFSKFVFSNSYRQQPSSSRSHSCTSISDSGADNDDDFQVAMVFDMPLHIAFWRPGQQHWIRPDLQQHWIPPTNSIIYSSLDASKENSHIRQIEDLCYFRGEFYSIDHYTQVIAYGSQVSKTPLRVVANLKSQGVITYIPFKFYMAVLDETTLLVVHRDIDYDESGEPDKYWAASFDLIQLNVDTGKASTIHDIGNRALFVGHNSTFFVEASPSDKRGCRPNSIYFTDDNIDSYRKATHGGGIDMGIFSLEENRVVDRVYVGPSQFNHQTSPIWVELPHC